MQRTIKSAVTLAGVGLHTGVRSRVTLRPASAEFGIWFRRRDGEFSDALIPARWDAVVAAPFCTRIENAAGASVVTVEHLMAALAGCGVHNLVVEIDGPEVPILDGSAGPFVAAILSRGLRRQDAPVRAFELRERVEVVRGGASAALEPSPGFAMDLAIDVAEAAIGRQALRVDLDGGGFVHELCDSRTFCRSAELDGLRARGLFRGGTLDSAVLVDGARVLNTGGLRRPDEAVRHEMLDAVGDLALAGAPLFGRYVGRRAGHALTNALLRELFARPGAVRMVICGPAQAMRLPGFGLTRGDLAGLPVAA